MRRTLPFLVSCLVLGLPALGLAEGGDDGSIRYCGSDYFYTFTPPEGWADASYPVGEELTSAFAPADGRDGDVLMTVGLVRRSFEDDLDLDFLLDTMVAGLAMSNAPTSIRDGAIEHDELRTRSAIMEFSGGQVHLVLMNARSGRGYMLSATLTVPGGGLSSENLERFRTAVASLRYDPTRVCKPGPDGGTLEKVVERPPLYDTDSEDEPGLTKGQRATRRALMGCGMLARLFVPVECVPGRLDRSPALVAIFGRDDQRSAKQNLETFRDRVTATYCWAARTEEIPLLAFGLDERDASGAEVEPLRRYSCKTGDFAETYARDRFEFDPDVYDEL